MVWVCKVLQNGHDAVVELPDEWVARYGVKVGDELRVSYTSDDGIVYSIINEDQGQEACEGGEREGSAAFSHDAGGRGNCERRFDWL